MATIFCKCGEELHTENIYNYDYDFDIHTYKCPECDSILTKNECQVTSYEVGDSVEYKSKTYTITAIFMDNYGKICVGLDNHIFTKVSELD